MSSLEDHKVSRRLYPNPMESPDVPPLNMIFQTRSGNERTLQRYPGLDQQLREFPVCQRAVQFALDLEWVASLEGKTRFVQAEQDWDEIEPYGTNAPCEAGQIRLVRQAYRNWSDGRLSWRYAFGNLYVLLLEQLESPTGTPEWRVYPCFRATEVSTESIKAGEQLVIVEDFPWLVQAWLETTIAEDRLHLLQTAGVDLKQLQGESGRERSHHKLGETAQWERERARDQVRRLYRHQEALTAWSFATEEHSDIITGLFTGQALREFEQSMEGLEAAADENIAALRGISWETDFENQEEQELSTVVEAFNQAKKQFRVWKLVGNRLELPKEEEEKHPQPIVSGGESLYLVSFVDDSEAKSMTFIDATIVERNPTTDRIRSVELDSEWLERVAKSEDHCVILVTQKH